MSIGHRGIWLSWHDHPRSHAIARGLGIPMLAYWRRRTGVLRHVHGTVWTMRMLLAKRPDVVFVQNSFLLLLVCSAYSRLRARRSVRIIADCHNKSLKRDLHGPLGPVFRLLKRWSFRRVDLIVVSNPLLIPVARRLGSEVVVLRDPLPELPAPSDEQDAGALMLPGLHHPYALFVCSFEPDEPAALVVSVAQAVAACGLHAVISGDSQGAIHRDTLKDCPGVFAPGFMPGPLYNALLHRAGAVVVLTNDQDCLVCGAYEAIAAERPLVLSDTPLLRSAFGSSAYYSPHEPAALKETILLAAGGLPKDFAQSKSAFKADSAREWEALLAALDRLLPEAPATGSPTGVSARQG